MMRSGVVSLALGVLVACGAKPATDQGRLPESARGRRVDAAGWITIDLEADGSLGLNEKEVSLAGLRHGLEREYKSTPKQVEALLADYGFEHPDISTRDVLVRIDPVVPYQHVAWVFGTLLWEDFNRVWIAVEHDGEVGAIRVPLVSAFWSKHPYDPVSPAAELPLIEAMRIDLEGAARYWVGERSTDDPALFLEWLRAERKRLKPAEPLGMLDVSARTPFGSVVEALDAFAEAGVKYVELAREKPVDPRDLERLRLPASEQWLVTRRRDLTFVRYPRVTLPVAWTARQDKNDDGDDRVVVTLDAHGLLMEGESILSLAALDERLAEAVRLYAIKMKRLGKSGMDRVTGGEVSSLFLLVRADRDAPWQHLQRVLLIAKRQRIYKVQLGTSLYAAPPYTSADAEALDVEWSGDPPGRRQYDAKLAVFLPMFVKRPRWPLVVRVVSPGPGVAAYRFAGRSTPDLSELRKWIASFPEEEVEGFITADPHVPVQYVVAVVDQFKRCRRPILDVVSDGELPDVLPTARRLTYPE